MRNQGYKWNSGVSQLIFNSNTSGSTGVDASIKSDTALIWNMVGSIERWVKRFVKYRETSISFNFEILDVNVFNKDAAVTRELSLANSGVPNKMKLAATAGLTPAEVLTNMIWENQILEIHKNWMPLQTSYTMSAGEEADVGRPDSNSDPTTPINDSTDKNKDSGDDDSHKVEE